MKKNYQTFIGIDVSKDKLDYCIVSGDSKNQQQFGVIANQPKAISKFIRAIRKCNQEIKLLFCLENTGIYSMPVCYWLQTAGLDYWVVPALEIKRSKGISRGKTDRTDAKDIAYYAITHLHQLRLSQLPTNDFLELRLLLAQREKIVKAIGTFNATKENKNFLPKENIKTILKHNQLTISFLQKQLKEIEKLIDKLIQNNETFKQQNELLQSIPGIGKQTSVTFIAYTQAFTLFKNHRQFACFAGVAPFEYSSGSSVRGRTKVSHLANKKIKTILNMAALSAKKYDPQLKHYFDKKIAEGKNKMLVLNAIRCKIISRAFAVINRNSKFVNTFKAVA
jgi:transposase